MSSSATPAVGAEDFLARYAPNLSRKERGSLTEMVRAAVRDYMSENRLTQPPPPRLLAHMMQQQRQRQPDSSAATASAAAEVEWRPKRRPATARGRFVGDVDGDADLCLVGRGTGVPTDTPRYAGASAIGQRMPAGKTFPDTLMGFVDRAQADEPAEKEEPAEMTESQSKQREADSSNERPAAAAAPATTPAPVKRPATANWLTWRGATPFCASDRELRAFRHRQNPRKPMPDEPPHVGLYRRPGTARGRLPTAAEQNSEGASPADRGILSWMKGANEHDKQVAYNLLKALDSNGGSGVGFEGLGIKGTAAAFDLNGPRRHGRGLPLPLPPPEDRHTFGRRTRPPTPQRLLHAAHADSSVKPATLFGGVEENFASVRSRVHPVRLSADYVHPGSGFTNACPPYRSNFVVHPDWVSEQTAPAPPPLRRSGAKNH